jgi:endo-1,4-beta-xylanase
MMMFKKMMMAVLFAGILSFCLAQSGDSTLAQLVSKRSGGTKYIGTVKEMNDYYSGFNSFNPQLDTIKKQFNIVTNQAIKMDYCHSSLNTYTFAFGDKVDTFAHVNNLKERGHTLVWPEQVPAWITDTNLTDAQRWTRLKNHVQTVMQHYNGRFYAVDVVNEALQWDPDTTEQPFHDDTTNFGFYYRHFGAHYVDSVFRWAHAADTNAKLFYNDYRIETVCNKSNSLYKLVKQWIADSVPIHGIGFEMHLSPDDTTAAIDFASIKQNVKRFTALGLDVHFTEIDVKLKYPNPTTHTVTLAQLRNQGHIYAELARIFLSEPRCRAFVMWGICDATTWIADDSTSGYGMPCIYDTLMDHKLAYDSLDTVIKNFSTTQKIALPSGWNMVSLNVRPLDSSTTTIFGSASSLTYAKDNAGKRYRPATQLDEILNLHTGQGYQVYTTANDTLRATGTAINVASTPISLIDDWNIVAYLPQIDLPISTALSGVISDLVMAKDNIGGIFWPGFGINSIGTMKVGQGYQVYMSAVSTLTYPSGLAKRNVAFEGRCLPKQQHFTINLNTGNSATLLAKSITINGIPVGEGSEMGVFDSKGNLVGSGGILNGVTAFSIWGDDSTTKEKDGCTASEPLTFKLWYNNQEYTLEPGGGVSTSFAKNAIITGAFTVSSKVVVSAFALAAAYPNPFRNNIKIAFDVPLARGGAEQQVSINVYDLKGSIVRKLVNSKYAAGRYTVNWDGTGEHCAPLSSSMYIVQMKADNYSKKLKLFRLK